MVIVEFNELIQSLHLNPIRNGVPQDAINTNGYQRLIICQNYDEADLFCDFLYEQYFKRGYKISYDEAEYTLKNICKLLSRHSELIDENKI